MTDENLYAFISRRERELRHQIAGLKGQLALIQGQLAQREYELVRITHIKATDIIEDALGVANLPQADSNATTQGGVANRPLPPEVAQRFAQMTIKECVIQALLDAFPDGGTAAQICDFMRDAYGRPIQPSSLRPQMHRLKDAGVLGQDPSSDTWNFRDGKRRLYAMYDHPTSRAGMSELKDDEIGENEPRTRLREVGEPHTNKKNKDDFLD